MSRRMDFRKPRLGEYTTASSLFMPASSRGFALFTKQEIGQLRIGLNLDIALLLKYDGNYNWFDFHTIRKAQMRSCGKTRNISTSLARGINNNKEITILRLRNASRKECRTIVFGVGTGPFTGIVLAEFIGYLPLILLVVCVHNSYLRSRYGA